MSQGPQMAQPQIALQPSQSLSVQTARNLATTTKTVPQMRIITPRWVLGLLPWVQVESGTYRVNRVKIVLRPDERIAAIVEGGCARIEPRHLRGFALFRHLDDALISRIAAALACEQCEAGQVIVPEGELGNRFFFIARGKVEITAPGDNGKRELLSLLGPGDYFGEMSLGATTKVTASVRTLTRGMFLVFDRTQLDMILQDSPEFRQALMRALEERARYRELANECGEKKIAVLAGHEGEPAVPETFVDYEEEPREYSLSAVQSIARVHTRVSDLYSAPIDQLREQLRLTVETIKERQEWELINNPDFGLLANAAPSMYVQTRTGPPTPDDLDELIARVWKKPAFFLAHPRAIAAFGRECTRRGVPPPVVPLWGCSFMTWRGIPFIPCDKMPITGASGESAGKSAIMLMRVGEKEQGVVGLHHAGLPGEVMPSLSVRMMGIDDKAIASYLLSLYFSVAVLTEDALGVLDNVDLGYYHDYA